MFISFFQKETQRPKYFEFDTRERTSSHDVSTLEYRRKEGEREAEGVSVRERVRVSVCDRERE